jgi:hypothetical protein
MFGSLTATPEISPSVSASAACSDAPAPLETDEAMTMVLPGRSCAACASGDESPRSSLST